MEYTSLEVLRIKDEHSFINFSSEQAAGLYRQCVERGISLPWYNESKHQLRKNVTIALCIRVLIPARADKAIWEEDVMSWIRNYFITNKFGIDLIIDSRVLDIGGEEFLCTTIVPVDTNGRVCASFYINGVEKLAMMQKSFFDFIKKKYNVHKVSVKKTSGLSKYNLDKDLNDVFAIRQGDDLQTYSNRVKQYTIDMKAGYNSSDMSAVEKENKEMKKKIRKYDNTVSAYCDFLEKYGSIKKAEEMILTAKQLQSGIKMMKEQNNQEGIRYVLNVLKAGKEYSDSKKGDSGLSDRQ